jgi:hypothetical protein
MKVARWQELEQWDELRFPFSQCEQLAVEREHE